MPYPFPVTSTIDCSDGTVLVLVKVDLFFQYNLLGFGESCWSFSKYSRRKSSANDKAMKFDLMKRGNITNSYLTFSVSRPEVTLMEVLLLFNELLVSLSSELCTLETSDHASYPKRYAWPLQARNTRPSLSL